MADLAEIQDSGTVIARVGNRVLIALDPADPLSVCVIVDERDGRALTPAGSPPSAAAALARPGWKPINDDAAALPEEKALTGTRARERAAYDAIFDRFEAEVVEALTAYWDAERDVVVELVERGTTKAVQTSVTTGGIDAATREIRVTLELNLVEIINRIVDSVIERLERRLPPVRPEPGDPDFETRLLDYVRRVMSLTEDRAQRIVDVIQDASQDEDDLRRVVDEVRGTYAQRLIWAETIARTEVGRVVNETALDAAVRAGMTTKEWLSSRDARVRASHREADGQDREIGETFLVGGFPMRYPHDPLGPPHEVINCRCVMTFGRG